MVLMGTDPGGPSAVRATPEAWAQLTDHSGTPREQASRLIPLLFPAALAPVIDSAFGDLIAQAADLSTSRSKRRSTRWSVWHANQPPGPARTRRRARW